MDDLSRQGIAHFNGGRFEEALRCFRAAAASGDGGPETKVFLGHVADSLGRRPEAIAAFTSVIKALPRHLPAYSGLANSLLHQSPVRDRAAEKTLLGILALRPGGAAFRPRLIDALRACGQAFRAVGDLENAEKALSKALVLGGRDRNARRRLVDVVRMRGQSYLSAGNLEKAEKELRKVLALDPDHKESRKGLVRLLGRRGEAAVAAGRLEHAEAALRKALLMGPRDKESRRQLAEVLLMREQAEQARLTAARLEKAERIRALLEELKAAGQAYEASARTRKAESLLRRALKIDPGDPRPYLLAGGILFSAGAAARGRALILRALRLDRGALGTGDRFSALMKLGRYKAAVALAEKVLDGKPGLADVRAFWDPWEWDGRPLDDRRRELDAFERALGPKASQPWIHYYRADLRGPEELSRFRKLASFPKRRYGWMLSKAGLSALCAGRFTEAEGWLRSALGYKTIDWRTRGFLAETLLCLRRPDEAFAELDRARTEAPADEEGQVVAWRGAFDLWLGRYDDAVRRFDEALGLGAPYALAWRAAALLKLGRAREALEQLDLALERYPRDLEAYVWRGEAKRALGLHREALEDLDEPQLKDADRATPIWLWALFNRALVKAALGDRAGLQADFDAIPARVLDYLRSKTGRAGMEELLQAGLELSRGFRREEYGQAIWMI